MTEKESVEQKLAKCQFYQVQNFDAQLCAYAGEEWKECFIAAIIDGFVLILRAEDNEFKGERKNRSIFAQLQEMQILDDKKVCPISAEQANHELKEHVRSYLSSFK